MDVERRRSAAAKRSRSPAPPPPDAQPPAVWPRALSAPLGALNSVTRPPRQLWLAALGSTALTVRAATELWSQLVAEGATVERSFRVPDFAGLLRRSGHASDRRDR